MRRGQHFFTLTLTTHLFNYQKGNISLSIPRSKRRKFLEPGIRVWVFGFVIFTEEMADEFSSEGFSEKGVEDVFVEDSNVEKIVWDQNSVEEDEGTPRVGMLFKTSEEVLGFYNRYACRVGFGTAIRRSYYSPEDKQCYRFTLTCCKEGKRVYKTLDRCRSHSLQLSARTDCRARIKVQKYVDGLFHLVEVNLEHNHEVSPSMVGFFRSHKRMAKKLPAKLEDCTGEAWTPFLGEDDVEALHEFFICMQTKNTNFFHLTDLDKGGHIRNVFWADGRCKAAYRCYSDVVTFDTTYLTGNYETPLVSFVGVNNHGQLVLLGCGLLSSRSRETYKWLFKVWLSCMSGNPPNAIITDHCKTIQEAVAEVFPVARHRLCLRHIMNRVQENLGGLADYEAIKEMLIKAVYESLIVEEFEEDWRNMIEKYGLTNNKCLKLLYEDKRSWVPVFVKGTFWAGMSDAQHEENMDSFFDGCVCAKTSVKQFIFNYELALQSKYEKEAQLDVDSLHKSPQLVTKFYMEDQLRNLYTINIFKKFQEEVKAVLYCIPSPVRIDGTFSVFEVEELVSMKYPNQTDRKNYKVAYNSNEHDVRCICCFFQFQGILCRHALSVLNFLGVYEIPSRYILERWRKDFKTYSSNDVVATGLMERYDHLHKCCINFVKVGAIADKNYEYAMQTLSGVTEELIESDCLISNMQPKRSSIAGSAKKGKRKTKFENDEKGPPLKMRKESLIEETTKTSQMEVTPRKPEVCCQSDVLRIAQYAPSFDSHSWTQEEDIINLADQVSPTNLSIGGFFGVQLNHQHAIDNQLGRPWSFQQMLQQAHIPMAPSGPWAG